MGYQKSIPDPKRLIEETVDDNYIVLTQRPNYAVDAAWKNEAERQGFIDTNSLRFLRPYQKKAIFALQSAVKDGKDRFLFEMATGTGKTLTSAAVIKLFLRTGTYLHHERHGTYQYAGYLIRYRIDPAKAHSEFIFHITQSDLWKEWILSNSKTGTLTNINAKQYSSFRFPLPPLEVQKEIVAEIEGYQKVINGARAVLDNYRPHIPIHPDWPMVALNDLCNIEHGYAFKGEFFVQEEANDLPILLTPGNFVQGGGLYFTEKNTKKYSGDFPDSYRLQRGDLVVVMTDLSPMMKILGMPAIIDSDHFLHNQRIGKIVLKSDQVLKNFLRYAFLLDGVNGRIKREATGSTVRHTSPSRILSVEIPLPPLETQQAIVAEIEAEQALVAANRELITRFEKKIQATLARVWGEA